jgi:hypothetical protein
VTDSLARFADPPRRLRLLLFEPIAELIRGHIDKLIELARMESATTLSASRAFSKEYLPDHGILVLHHFEIWNKLSYRSNCATEISFSESSFLIYWRFCVVGVTSLFLTRLSISQPWKSESPVQGSGIPETKQTSFGCVIQRSVS